MILMPMNRYVGVSARVTDPEERRALQEAGREIAQERFGLVMRQAAAQAQEGRSFGNWRICGNAGKLFPGGRPRRTCPRCWKSRGEH